MKIYKYFLEYINLDSNLPFEKFMAIDENNNNMTEEPQNNPILAFKTEKMPLMKEKSFFGKF